MEQLKESEVKLAKTSHGIDYQFKNSGVNMKRLEKKTTMVDSAIVLFPYYKLTLTKNGDTWFIETDKNYRKVQKAKKNKYY